MRKTRVFGKTPDRTGKTGNHNKTTMQGPTCFKAKSSLPSKNLGNLPAVTLHDLSQAKAEQQKQQSARCVGTIVTVSPPTQQPLLPGAADTSQKSWPILGLVAQTSLVSVWTWHVHTRTERPGGTMLSTNWYHLLVCCLCHTSHTEISSAGHINYRLNNAV